VLLEPLHRVPAHGEAQAALGDLRDQVGRHPAGLAEQTGRDGNAAEDVAVADDLLDLADLAALGVDDLPPRLDEEPGDGRHAAFAHTERPSTYQTGP
jgi:hypothetical protein